MEMNNWSSNLPFYHLFAIKKGPENSDPKYQTDSSTSLTTVP
ncbi:protein of unknown function [Lactiplantibacillus plantarum]